MSLHTAPVVDRNAADASPSVDGGADRRAVLLVALAVAIPTLLLTATAIARFLNGRAGIDLAIFDQGLWALSRGDAPWSSVIQQTLIEDHFSPGLLLFAAVYRIVATPIWLIVAQGLAGGLSAWLVSRRLIPVLGPRRAATVGACLLASPPVAYALLFDVHSIVLGTPFVLAAAFSLEDGRPRRAAVFGVLAGLFRMELAVAVVVAFAAAPGERRGRLRPAFLVAAVALLSVFIEKEVGHDFFWEMHYEHLGRSPGDALAHPFRLVGSLVSVSAVSRALPWLATGAFLALRRPRLLLPAAVVALPVLLSRWGGTSGIWFQYGFAPTFLLTLAWIPELRRRPERTGWVVIGSLGLAFLIGPLPSPLMKNAEEYFLTTHWKADAEALCLVEGIPADAGVSADLNHLSLLAHRDDAYLWPYPFAGTRPDVLPAPHLGYRNAAAAARVDYIILPQSVRETAEPGFVDDGRGRFYMRLRRATTTEAGATPCL